MNKQFIIDEKDLISITCNTDFLGSIDIRCTNYNTKPLYKKAVIILQNLPTRYIINDGAVILFWNDGTKTIVKRSEDDKFDPVKGFLWAYFQKHSGLSKTKANKYLRDLDNE